MERQCSCGRRFEWSEVAEYAVIVMNKMLEQKGREPLQILCPQCRKNQELSLWRRTKEDA